MTILQSIAGALAVLVVAACQSTPSATAPEQARSSSATELPVLDFVFGDDRPFAQSHASTLIRLHNGDFLVAWFGGTHEKHDDVGIWMSKGRPGAWKPPFQVAKIDSTPHWNPVLFQPGSDSIYLFFKVGKEIAAWQTRLMVSGDAGDTWTADRDIVLGSQIDRGPVRNKPIVLSNGTWIAGTSSEQGNWEAFFDRSEDQGKTWQRTLNLPVDRNVVSGKGIIQPTLWESAPGSVHALLRSTSGFILRSDSKDYGKTWTPAYKTALPNPNSGIDLTRLSDGTLVLAFNTDSTDWGSRATISLALSTDNGATWPQRIDIESDKDKKVEFSYPAVIHFGDTIALTYTWKREKIRFWMGTREGILQQTNGR